MLSVAYVKSKKVYMKTNLGQRCKVQCLQIESFRLVVIDDAAGRCDCWLLIRYVYFVIFIFDYLGILEVASPVLSSQL